MTIADNTVKYRYWVVATVITCATEIPFALLAMGGPHSDYGQFGMLFFMSGLGLITFFSLNWWNSQASTFFSLSSIVIAQTLLLVPLPYWILTRRRRRAAKTVLQTAFLLALIFLFSRLSIGVNQLQVTAQLQEEKASHLTAVNSLRTLNAALSKYKVTYGAYPSSVRQLGVARRNPAPGRENAALITEPLGVEEYFVLSYQVRLASHDQQEGYEIHLDPRTAGYLSHYFSDQTGLIRSDRNPATAKSLVIEEDLQPRVTVQ